MNAGDPPPLITECPNCYTRFRVGESQLQMAHGRVRCGACLAVFAGVDHLLLDDNAESPELPAESDALDSVLAELEVSSDPAAESADAADAATSEQADSSKQAEGGSVKEDLDETDEIDWTEVSVDTSEIGSSPNGETPQQSLDGGLDGGLDGAPDDRRDSSDSSFDSVGDYPLAHTAETRVTISEAIEDAEALRWWLEDELPGSTNNTAGEDPANDPASQGMVVQLSQLDAVQDEELDLKTLIGAGEEGGGAAIEKLFREHSDEARAERPAKTPARTRSGQKAKNKTKAKEETAAMRPPARSKTEPLTTRVVENGTIAAAAARMESARSKTSKTLAPNKPAKPTIKPEVVEPADISGLPDADFDLGDDPLTQAKKAIASNLAAAEAATEASDKATETGLVDRARAFVGSLFGGARALRLATIMAFVLLTAQVLYWQFDDWSKTNMLRPVYAGICTVLGCELPARRSVGQLQSKKLAVRSHPDKPDTLLVDALIINEAEFEQPFPVIVMEFMDIREELVGSFQLEPDVYLDGELAGSSALMAVRTPVHIDIDIPDPGPKAVNYQLKFR